MKASSKGSSWVTSGRFTPHATSDSEALRLAHKEGLYQEEAAARMGVSRATFGRVLDSAHRIETTALVEGCALRVEGGSFCMVGPERCQRCKAKVNAMEGQPSPCEDCPVKPSES